MKDVFYVSDYKIRVGKWALAPCWRCGEQPEPGLPIQLDWMAQTVLCNVCHSEDNRKMAEALGKAIGRHIDGDAS